MLQAYHLTKSFSSANADEPALKDVSLRVEQGEFVAVAGRSGSGKSTLLNVLSTLLRPDSGRVYLDGLDLTELSAADLDKVRRSDVAMVFQFHYLLPYLTAMENVLLPHLRSMKPVNRAAKAAALDCLNKVGLAGKARRLPGELSGGEQQRVAIARALAQESRILFADEPTGSLDKATGEEIMALLRELNRQGLTIVMVTHEREYAALADRVVQMADGAIVDQ